MKIVIIILLILLFFILFWYCFLFRIKIFVEFYKFQQDGTKLNIRIQMWLYHGDKIKLFYTLKLQNTVYPILCLYCRAGIVRYQSSCRLYRCRFALVNQPDEKRRAKAQTRNAISEHFVTHGDSVQSRLVSELCNYCLRIQLSSSLELSREYHAIAQDSLSPVS